MMSGDELYDDEVTSGLDPLAMADFRRDQLKDSSACFTCGSPDPAIIEGRYCCDCTGEDAEAFDQAREDRLAEGDWNREGLPEFNGAFR